MIEEKYSKASRLMAETLVFKVMNKDGLLLHIKPILLREKLNEVLNNYPGVKMEWSENIREGKIFCKACQQIILTKSKASIEFYFKESDATERITNLIATILIEAHKHIGRSHL